MNVALKMFKRYEQQAQYDEQMSKLKNKATTETDIPAAVQEVEITSPSLVHESPVVKREQSDIAKNPCEYYNGDNRGTYCWSQTIQDVDVLVTVPPDILKSKQLAVIIESTSLKIEIFNNGAQKQLLEQQFPFKVAKNECFWSLVPSEHIHVNYFINIFRYGLF